MIEETKEVISQLEITIQILQSILNCTHVILNNSYSIHPYNTLTGLELEYTTYIPEFDSRVIYSMIFDLLSPFHQIFFNNAKLRDSHNKEREVLLKLHQALYGRKQADSTTISGLITLFEKEKVNPLHAPVVPKDLTDKLVEVLEAMDTLSELQNSDLEKGLPVLQAKAIQKEKTALKSTYTELESITTVARKNYLFELINEDFSELKSLVTRAIKNKRLRNTKIIESLYIIEKQFELKNLCIGRIIYIHKIVTKELQEKTIRKEVEENTLQQTLIQLGYTENLQKQKIYTEKLNSFKQDQTNTEGLNKVIAQARDPSTAIKHSEIGKELQLYFNKVEEDELIVLKGNSEQELSQDKKDINHWFKYGSAEEEKKETSIRNTTFGVSLNKLLADSGIDPSKFDNLIKKNKE